MKSWLQAFGLALLTYAVILVLTPWGIKACVATQPLAQSIVDTYTSYSNWVTK